MLPRRPLLLVLAAFLAGCGASGEPYVPPPFDTPLPQDVVGGGGVLPPDVPPPALPRVPVFDADAHVHGRTLPYGSFPSDVVRRGDVVWTTDADEVDHRGATVVALDVSGPTPRASSRHAPFTLHASDLVDSQGAAGDLARPIGFGFFVNDLAVVSDDLAFVLANAGGSDSAPGLSNLVAFDPSRGRLRQVVNLASTFAPAGAQADSAGVPVPPSGFLQSGAEALAYVPGDDGRGQVFVAMTNPVVGAPSWGTVKYPGTIQVFDVDPAAGAPVAPRSDPRHATLTFPVGGYNPVALVPILPQEASGWARSVRLLVTVAGATAFDAQGSLVPATEAAVEAWEASGPTYLGRFALGLTALAPTRPALGRDGAGHRVGFFPSAATGEVYLLLLDGLYGPNVDPQALAVLRGPGNGIPIAPGQAGSPGGSLTGVGISPDGRTLVVAAFGNLFFGPEPRPGSLHLLALPQDLVTGNRFGADFVPGVTLHATAPGRLLGPLVLVPNGGSRPDVYVAVSGAFDPATLAGAGPASLGSLQTFGLIR